MPRRDDLDSILVIGSGPIVIGQACEFDYSGTQAVKVLREKGYRVILVNSNPATIMTDPELADATYVEPITAGVIEAVLDEERPDAVLATLGGQTALNVTMELEAAGVFDKLGVELIGAGIDAIATAEDRGRFKAAMTDAGITTARSRYVHSAEAAIGVADDLGYPVMVRPSFILGGGGTGLAADVDELREVVAAGLSASPVGEVLVEESLAGWKEFELEVMRDAADNAVVVCSIENLDPMGVHTGDSITVAPAITLSDREYQEMRDEAMRCLRAIGVDTGGSNVQFAVEPDTGRRVIIEMNPRVSRSSALASKATGFPIAKIAALLAVGYRLDEIVNDITGATPASFEPALDYIVVKVPRFDFDKFPSTSRELGTAMQSVGEAMAIGRSFPEALQKALRSLETGRCGLNADGGEARFAELEDAELERSCAVPSPDRIFAVAEALRRGAPVSELAGLTSIDPWFIAELEYLVARRVHLAEVGPNIGEAGLREAKRAGFSDAQLAYLWGMPEQEVAAQRRRLGVVPVYKTVDTCAAEFEAHTPYFYGTYEDEDEAPGPRSGTVVVLGSGPNRIGQGIEFDYCCVHAALALRDAGYRTVMVNCNPETVSTDYDTSDRLYFEPLTTEDVLAVIESERPEAVVVQLGGQTPLGLAHALEAAGVTIAGTSPDAIDLAEDRERFSALCSAIGVPQPAHGLARSAAEAEAVVARIGLPVLARPSYVLGGRAMRVIYSMAELAAYTGELYGPKPASDLDLSAAPLLLDRFLESAVEVDVDAIFDGEELFIGGVMEHIEEAGVHSGDSACVVPAQTLSSAAHEQILEYTGVLARGLEVKGLLNIQYAVRGDDVFVLEANPRASRTIPFISKATGIPLAKLATRVMLGETLAALRAAGVLSGRVRPDFVAIKEAVLPWSRFPEEDTILGPEMRATGEVMGIGPDLGIAFGKSLLAAGHRLPDGGRAFVSLADRDKPLGPELARRFVSAGFSLLATHGTAGNLARHRIAATHVDKVGEGSYDPVRLIEEGAIDLVVNTPRGRRARGDGGLIRRAATRHGVPCVTTVQGGLAVAGSLGGAPTALARVGSLQMYHERLSDG